MRRAPMIEASTEGDRLSHRNLAFTLAALGIAAVVAVPALAAAPAPPPSVRPAHEQAQVDDRRVSLTGRLSLVGGSATDVRYRLEVGDETYDLDAGPAWFFADDHPLAAYVGRTVTIVGERSRTSGEIEVLSVDGTTLREPGRPPWAGGWKRVGERHPGWSQEKADRHKARFGDCFPPGHCKKHKKGKRQGPDTAP